MLTAGLSLAPCSYAQDHYPFENSDSLVNFPPHHREGVDQTRLVLHTSGVEYRAV